MCETSHVVNAYLCVHDPLAWRGVAQQWKSFCELGLYNGNASLAERHSAWESFSGLSRLSPNETSSVVACPPSECVPSAFALACLAAGPLLAVALAVGARRYLPLLYGAWRRACSSASV